MKLKIFALWCLLSCCVFQPPTFAHAPVQASPSPRAVAADDSLSSNYVITFTITSGDVKQEAELVTARRAVSFDLADDPEHSLRFQGELKIRDGGRIALSYSATLTTIMGASPGPKHSASTSGSGAILLELNKPATILKTPRQQLAITIRTGSPAQMPGDNTAPARN
jgi:hypothetical protein